MVRFSVSLDEEQNDWVEEQAEELNGSKAQVIGMVIDTARKNELPLGSTLDTGSDETGEAIETRLQSLESRVAELESGIQTSAPEESTSASPEEESHRPPQQQAASTNGVTSADGSDAGGNPPAVDREDPEYDAVQTFIQREANQEASEEQITACWEFLKQRGTASPRAFKNQFAPESCSTEDDVDIWWEDGVKPVLRQLPGVEPPEDGGRFYRYKY